jgi:hypothetical protein
VDSDICTESCDQRQLDETSRAIINGINLFIAQRSLGDFGFYVIIERKVCFQLPLFHLLRIYLNKALAGDKMERIG